MPLAYSTLMKNLILCCLVALALGSFVGCSDTSSQTASTTTSSTAMQPDPKDVHK